MRLYAGEAVITQDTAGDIFYIVQEGTANVYVTSEGEEDAYARW